MSRFDDSCEPGDMPAVFWKIDLERALTSGRGQRILRDIEAGLLAMPQHELIAGEIARFDEDSGEGAVCAIGAYAAWRAVKDGQTWQSALAALAERLGGEQDDQFNTEQLGRGIGLARTVATELAWQNDERFGDLTPEDRWTAVLGWVRSEIKSEPVEVPG